MANFEAVKDGKPITLQYMQAQKSKGAVMNFCCCDCG